MGSTSRGEDELQKMEELSKTLKEGERILAPTRRPDGTLRKPIRIRAGYVPQEEVEIYQSKGALWRKEMASLQQVPPGYDPVSDSKPKTKSAKRNERKKEKRQQAALEKAKNSEQDVTETIEVERQATEVSGHEEESIKSLTTQINELVVAAKPLETVPSSDAVETNSSCSSQDIDKRIRALKKKIRLAEAQNEKTQEKDLKPEQLEKIAKLEGWRHELKLLEDKKAEQTT